MEHADIIPKAIYGLEKYNSLFNRNLNVKADQFKGAVQLKYLGHILYDSFY